MSVRSTTPHLNLIKYDRGHSVPDIDLGINMDLIDADSSWVFDALVVDDVLFVAKSNENSPEHHRFNTIQGAIDYAMAHLPEWPGRCVIKISPGIYTETLSGSFYRIVLVGDIEHKFEVSRGVVVRNTGADDTTYPLADSSGFVMIGIDVVTTDEFNEPVVGAYGPLCSGGTFINCNFENGYFIENTEAISYYVAFAGCSLYGDSFNLTGVNLNNYRFIDMRNCFLSDGTCHFGSTGTPQTIKFDRCQLCNDFQINGDWSLLSQWSEHVGTSKLTFDTNGYVDIFACVMRGGVHFYSDTPETKKVVNCIFKDTPVGEGDITADVSVEFIEYSGNHQHNGIDGEIITVLKIKNVGGGQNQYRDIYEALKGSLLTDTIINLGGDVEVSEPLEVNPDVHVQIDGNKKWSLDSTAASTLVELGNNQSLSFVNMKQITGGKNAIVNGTNASLSFISCGVYTKPNYVNIILTSGDALSGVYIVESSIIGTGAPVVVVNDVDPFIVVDSSFIMGASGHPAINWSVLANSTFRGKYSTFVHGSDGANAPLIYTGDGRMDIALYNSALNAAFDASDFNNTIGSPNITIDAGIDY